MAVRPTHYPQFDPSAKFDDLNIDRRLCQRTVPMQVLSLGMPRTGTASMKVALHILGYNEVYHFLSVVQNIRDAEIWASLLDKTYTSDNPSINWRTEFDGVLGHCAAITDSPAIFLGPQLIKAYPSAKVILVERDLEDWVRSFTPLAEGFLSPFFAALSYLDPKWTGRMSKMRNAWAHGFWEASNEKELMENLRPVYRRHYKNIREAVAEDMILEYQLGSGWEPLCRFLGKEVPDIPFPRINESAMLQVWISMVRRKSMMNALKNIAVVGSVLTVTGFAVYWGFQSLF